MFTSIAPVYPVEDVESSVEWYERVLGFQAVHVNRDPDGDDPTNYAVLNREAVWLHLIRRADASDGFDGRAAAQFTVSDGLDELFRSLNSDGNKVWISQPTND